MNVWCVWYVCVVVAPVCGVCVCIRSHLRMRPLGESSSILVVWFLISGYLIPRSPSEGLVEAAISTQHSPQTTWEAFYPALCSLFFNQHFSFTCLYSQIASFVFFFHNEPVSPTTWLCILFLFHFQKFIFRWRLSFCSEKCHRSKCRQAKTPQRLHGTFS